MQGSFSVFVQPFIVLSALTLLFVGCGTRNPVQPISVGQSGIELRTSEWSLAPSDWNAWRGPSRDGVADADAGAGAGAGAVATSWNDSKNVQWRADISGRGHGSPIVVGGAVFLATADEAKQTQSVVSLDRESGLQRWQTEIHQGGFPAKNSVHKKATNANGTIAK